MFYARQKICWSLWIVTGFLVTALPAQEIRWILTTGDKFEVLCEQQTTTLTTVDKRQTKINSSTSIAMNWTVTAVDDQGIGQIDQEITAIRLDVANPEVPSQAIAFDTASPTKPSPESAKILKQVLPLMGLKFAVTMSPAGEIIDVTLPDETQKVLRELPGALRLQELFSAAGIKDLLGNSAIVLPDKTDRNSAGWTVQNTVNNSFGEFVRVRKYTIPANNSETGPNRVTLNLVASMQPAEKISDKQAGELISFSETGDLIWDAERGFFVSSKILSTTKTAVPYHESKIETTVENTNSMTIKKN